MEQYIGEWDNFQQYWLENTEEEQHREVVETKHRHFVLRITKHENEGHAHQENPLHAAPTPTV